MFIVFFSSNFGYITLILNDGSETKLFVPPSQNLKCLRPVCIYSRCFYESTQCHFKALCRCICLMLKREGQDTSSYSYYTNITQWNKLSHTWFNIGMNSVHDKPLPFLQITRQIPKLPQFFNVMFHLTCYTTRCSLFQRRIRNDWGVHTS